MAFREAGFINSEPTFAECFGLSSDNLYDFEESFGEIRRQNNGFPNSEGLQYGTKRSTGSISSTEGFYYPTGSGFVNNNNSINTVHRINAFPVVANLEENKQLNLSPTPDLHCRNLGEVSPSERKNVLSQASAREYHQIDNNWDLCANKKIFSQKTLENFDKERQAKTQHPSKMDTLLKSAFVKQPKDESVVTDQNDLPEINKKNIENTKPESSSWNGSKKKKKEETDSKSKNLDNTNERFLYKKSEIIKSFTNQAKIVNLFDINNCSTILVISYQMT